MEWLANWYLAFVVLAVVFWVFVLIERWLGHPPKPLTLREFERLSDGDYVLHLTCGCDRFSVRGQCTVWYYYPSGVRCSTSTESKLADIWTRLEWERRDRP